MARAHARIEMIVVEQDAYPRLAPPLAHPGARVVFAYNAGPFNKAWALNVGARVAAGDVLRPATPTSSCRAGSSPRWRCARAKRRW